MPGAKSSIRWGRLLCLGPACVASVVLVLCVGLMIGLMQFKARLLSLQPAVPMQEIVFFADTERQLREAQKKLEEAGKKLGPLYYQYTVTRNEIDQRIDRVCALIFLRSKDSSNRLKACDATLRRIPFDFPGVTPVAVSAEKPAHNCIGGTGSGLSSSDLETIRNQLLKQEPELQNDADLVKLVALYDLGVIACKNQQLLLHLTPETNEVWGEYAKNCDFVQRLVTIVQRYKSPGSQAAPRACVVPVNPTWSFGAEGAIGGGSVGGAPIQGAATVLQTSPAPMPPGTAQPAPPPTGRAPGGATPAGTTQVDTPPAAATPAAPTPAAPTPPAVTPGGTITGGAAEPSGATPGGTTTQGQPTPASAELSIADRQRMFELVNSYAFYDGLTGRVLANLLLSPIDFLALMIVTFGGVLGAMLRIIFTTSQTGVDPSPSDLFVMPILGLMCALVVYVLFRAGFIALTDHGPQSTDASALSPFVVAIMSIGAGMLSEQAIQLFRRSSIRLLGTPEGEAAARYAIHLGGELQRRGISVATLARRLKVDPSKVEDWISGQETVAVPMQDAIALLLDLDASMIFSDLKPARTGPAPKADDTGLGTTDATRTATTGTTGSGPTGSGPTGSGSTASEATGPSLVTPP